MTNVTYKKILMRFAYTKIIQNLEFRITGELYAQKRENHNPVNKCKSKQFGKNCL